MTTLAIPQQHAWKANVFAQLKERNRSETSGYVDLIKQCNVALRKEKECRDRALALEKEVLALRSENSGLKRGSTVIGRESVGAVSSTPELESRLSKLQEELTVSYKRNSDNAQLMLELSKKAKEAEEELNRKEAEVAQLKARLEEEISSYSALTERMEESERSLQLVKTELMAVQEKASLLSAENLKLEGENQQLVERWLKKMAEEAEKMNEANQFYQEMVQAHQRVEVMKVTNAQGPTPMGIGTPIVKKLGFFDDVSFMDCSAILPSKAKKKINQHAGEVTCVTFSKSGLTMASGSIDKTVRLWDAPTGTAKTTLQGPTQSVMSVQFSPSDEFIAGASNDNACRIWHLETCRLRHTLTGHVGKVFSCVFADAQKLFTGSHDRTIKMWDLTKGYSTRTIFCFSSLNDMCIAPDGALLVSGHMDHHLRFWDTKSGEVVHVMDALHENNITSVSLSTDGMKVLTNSRDNTMKIVDIRTHEVIITLKDENYRNGLSWTRACLSPDMRYAAAGSMDGTLLVWNTNTGKVEKSISNVHTSPIAACSWNLMGSQFATAGDKDKMIVLWE